MLLGEGKKYVNIPKVKGQFNVVSELVKKFGGKYSHGVTDFDSGVSEDMFDIPDFESKAEEFLKQLNQIPGYENFPRNNI